MLGKSQTPNKLEPQPGAATAKRQARNENAARKWGREAVAGALSNRACWRGRAVASGCKDADAIEQEASTRELILMATKRDGQDFVFP